MNNPRLALVGLSVCSLFFTACSSLPMRLLESSHELYTACQKGDPEACVAEWRRDQDVARYNLQWEIIPLRKAAPYILKKCSMGEKDYCKLVQRMDQLGITKVLDTQSPDFQCEMGNVDACFSETGYRSDVRVIAKRFYNKDNPIWEKINRLEADFRAKQNNLRLKEIQQQETEENRLREETEKLSNDAEKRKQHEKEQNLIQDELDELLKEIE